MKRKQHSHSPPDREVRTKVFDEQRSEPRRRALGEVRLFMGEAPLEIRGRLVDTSRSGFRATHPAATLRSGQIVGFEHGQHEGTARTIWTRIAGGRIESGFLILDAPATP